MLDADPRRVKRLRVNKRPQEPQKRKRANDDAAGQGKSADTQAAASDKAKF